MLGESVLQDTSIVSEVMTCAKLRVGDPSVPHVAMRFSAAMSYYSFKLL